MRTPRHRRARAHDLRELREIHHRAIALSAAFFPSGAHYHAVCRIAEAARECAVVWTGDDYAFRGGGSALRAPDQAQRMLAEDEANRARRSGATAEAPKLTFEAMRLVLNAHPDPAGPTQRAIRAVLTSVPADMTAADVDTMWLRVTDLFDDLPLVELQAVRHRLSAIDSDHGRTAAWWFAHTVQTDAFFGEPVTP